MLKIKRFNFKYNNLIYLGCQNKDYSAWLFVKRNILCGNANNHKPLLNQRAVTLRSANHRISAAVSDE